MNWLEIILGTIVTLATIITGFLWRMYQKQGEIAMTAMDNHNKLANKAMEVLEKNGVVQEKLARSVDTNTEITKNTSDLVKKQGDTLSQLLIEMVRKK